MSEILKWLEEESDRLAEECHSNADPHKTVNNSFLEGFNYALANVQGLEQPQLNPNQQKYLKELQYNRERLGNTHDALFFGLVDYEKRWNFNDENFAQVLQIFSQRTLEQEEE